FLSFVFFVSDAPRPPLDYTLSLHDALPISGSGKSSLAFDTIYAEGQRRYVESLSAYARQFLQMMEKPDVDHIDGLSPAISIDQKDRKSTRLNSSHVSISYAVFCLKKKNKTT